MVMGGCGWNAVGKYQLRLFAEIVKCRGPCRLWAQALLTGQQRRNPDGRDISRFLRDSGNSKHYHGRRFPSELVSRSFYQARRTFSSTNYSTTFGLSDHGLRLAIQLEA